MLGTNKAIPRMGRSPSACRVRRHARRSPDPPSGGHRDRGRELSPQRGEGTERRAHHAASNQEGLSAIFTGEVHRPGPRSSPVNFTELPRLHTIINNQLAEEAWARRGGHRVQREQLLRRRRERDELLVVVGEVREIGGCGGRGHSGRGSGGEAPMVRQCTGWRDGQGRGLFRGDTRWAFATADGVGGRCLSQPSRAWRASGSSATYSQSAHGIPPALL